VPDADVSSLKRPEMAARELVELIAAALASAVALPATAAQPTAVAPPASIGVPATATALEIA
jgi:hypothetical protein